MIYSSEKMFSTIPSFTGMNPDSQWSSLRADCENCFGFCCVALYFSASEGFPVDKDAGVPCPNLQSDFRCKVHKNLKTMGLKGCTAYDCFGAGQKVAKVIYRGHDWIKVPESVMQMYDVFLVMRQIHEMLWYLKYALSLKQTYYIQDELNSMFNETEHLTFLSADSIIRMDVAEHRTKVSTLLLKASELVRASFRNEQKAAYIRRKTLGGALDLIGTDLKSKDLKGENLRGAYLIASDLRGVDLSGVDFIGADLRDADLRGADLTYSIFLTQGQINSAKGDSSTRLPMPLTKPKHWSEL